MIDMNNYDPKCPDCGWKIDEDVYYQISEFENCATHLVLDEELKPIPNYAQYIVYPIMEEKENEWIETHCCLNCKKEYIVSIPKIKDEV